MDSLYRLEKSDNKILLSPNGLIIIEVEVPSNRELSFRLDMSTTYTVEEDLPSKKDHMAEEIYILKSLGDSDLSVKENDFTGDIELRYRVKSKEERGVSKLPELKKIWEGFKSRCKYVSSKTDLKKGDLVKITGQQARWLSGRDSRDKIFKVDRVDRFGIVSATSTEGYPEELNFFHESLELVPPKLRKYSKSMKDKNKVSDRLSTYFNRLVPNSGNSSTVEGEMVRAINRIIYRFLNDGDYWHEGYGTETAGPAESYLSNSKLVKRTLGNSLHSKLVSALKKSEVARNDDKYMESLLMAGEVILEHLDSVPYPDRGWTSNKEDMWEYKSKFENVMDEDDFYEDDFDDDYDESEWGDEMFSDKSKSNSFVGKLFGN